jgi:hypothetical protein
MAAWMRPRTAVFSIRHTPSPTAGIRCPLLSVTAGGVVVDVVFLLLLLLLLLLLPCPLPLISFVAAGNTPPPP